MTSPRRATGGIGAVGVAAPTLRLAAQQVAAAWGRGSGRSTVAVCGPDEDALTLAWTAAQRALDAADVGPDEIEGLWWGCTRPPFAEGPSLAHLAAALRLSSGTGGTLCSGSPHAGMDALLAAADAVAAGRVSRALVVASDALRPALGSGFESSCGAGAIAFVVASEGPARLGEVATSWRPVLDRYRGDLESETRDVYDPRLFREEVFLPLCTEVATGVAPAADDRWALPDPDGRLGAALARRLGLAAAASAPARAAVGDVGAASPLIGIAASLASEGRAGVLAYGGGRATALTLDVIAPVPGADRALDDLAGGREAAYTEVLRARAQLQASGEVVEMAVPPGSAMFVRGAAEVLGLHGARCRTCSTVNTPPDVHPTCTSCGGDELDLMPLARRGRVETFVVNQTMPAPFVAPLPLVVIELEDGARLMVQGTGDGTDLSIGAPVELVLRRYAVERGVPVYGYKAVVDSEPDGEPDGDADAGAAPVEEVVG